MGVCVCHLHSWVRVGMTGGGFFLAAPQVAASPGRRAAPASSWHLQTKGPQPSRGLSPGRHSPGLGLGSESSSEKRAAGRALDGALQSSALKRKEREAPQDSPRARKKVMRAPATSLSCGSTCLERTGIGALRKYWAKLGPTPVPPSSLQQDTGVLVWADPTSWPL